MAIVENRWIIALIGLAVVYLGYRIFTAVSKSQKLYQENVDKIINSDEYKVKGRFE